MEMSSNQKTTSFDSLPRELQTMIFNYLSLQDLQTTSRISKSWNDAFKQTSCHQIYSTYKNIRMFRFENSSQFVISSFFDLLGKKSDTTALGESDVKQSTIIDFFQSAVNETILAKTPSRFDELKISECVLNGPVFSSLPPHIKKITILNCSVLDETAASIPAKLKEAIFCNCTVTKKQIPLLLNKLQDRTWSRCSIDNRTHLPFIRQEQQYRVTLSSKVLTAREMELLSEDATEIQRRELKLENCTLTEEASKTIPNTFISLRLSRCRADGQAIAAAHHIKQLHLFDCQVNKDMLKLIPLRCTSLEVTNCTLTEEVLRAIPEHITYISIVTCKGITESDTRFLETRGVCVEFYDRDA